MPVIAAAITAVQGVKALGIGGTKSASTSERRAEANAALQRALSGDRVTLNDMMYWAFAPNSGRPAEVDALMAAAVREYYKLRPQETPPAEYAAKISQSATRSAVQQIIDPLLETVGQSAGAAAGTAAAERAASEARKLTPWLIAGGVAVVVLAYFALRK